MSTPRHILVLTYWCFSDALVQTYTLPYLRIIKRVLPPGSNIHLVTLEKPGTSFLSEKVEEGIQHHPFAYFRPGPGGAFKMLALVRRLAELIRVRKVDTIHAWCTPAGMIGYLLSVLTGRPLVLDSYEPHAEAMVENGTWTKGSMAFKVLFLFERLQSRRASVLIAAAKGMKEYARAKYGVVGKPFFVKPACVDLERFSDRELKRPDLVDSLGLRGKLVAVYAGKLGGIYLDKEVFDLLRIARDHWGERFHVLLLTAHTIQEVMAFAMEAGLDEAMFTVRYVPHAEIPAYMGLGDFALTPVRPVPTKRFCTPIKDGEYWALGLPVIITAGISDDSELIRSNGIGAVLDGLGPEHYQAAVETIDQLLATRTPSERYGLIRPIAEKYRNFGIAGTVYTAIYGSKE